MNNNDYVRLSLELHLFFARIMKEHAFFIEMSLTEKDRKFKKIASDFQNTFSNILETVVSQANGSISQEVIASGEIVTNNTITAENRTSELTGTRFNSQITMNELRLQGGRRITTQLARSVSSINRRTLPIIKQFIDFKNEILNQVLTCKMFTGNYPALVAHIRNEARMYYNLLSRIESRQPITQEFIYQQEQFWNNIMKEHAEFIRGLLDPSEEKLIAVSNEYVQKYERILNSQSNLTNLTNKSLSQTTEFRNFKIAGEEGIISCKIKSIIIPLLADHVVREANHFIRLLKSYQQNMNNQPY